MRFHADVGRRGVRAGRPTTKTTAPGGAAPPPACPRGTATADAAAPTGKALKNLRHVRRGALGRILKRDGHIRALASAAFAHWRALPPPAPPAVADAAAAAAEQWHPPLTLPADTEVPCGRRTCAAAAARRPCLLASLALDTRRYGVRDSPNRSRTKPDRAAVSGPEPGFEALQRGCGCGGDGSVIPSPQPSLRATAGWCVGGRDCGRKSPSRLLCSLVAILGGAPPHKTTD